MHLPKFSKNHKAAVDSCFHQTTSHSLPLASDSNTNKSTVTPLSQAHSMQYIRSSEEPFSDRKVGEQTKIPSSRTLPASPGDSRGTHHPESHHSLLLYIIQSMTLRVIIRSYYILLYTPKPATMTPYHNPKWLTVNRKIDSNIGWVNMVTVAITLVSVTIEMRSDLTLIRMIIFNTSTGSNNEHSNPILSHAWHEFGQTPVEVEECDKDREQVFVKLRELGVHPMNLPIHAMGFCRQQPDSARHLRA